MFVHTERVYYSDTDCGQIVYHARYLDFAEHARTEMLRSIGKDGSQNRLMERNGIAFVVKSIVIDYLKPGKLDDLLVVETSVVESKHFSMTFLQTVKRDGEPLCTLRVKVASIDMETHRPVALPPAVLSALADGQEGGT
jgi:acyl-CoA thioester hydrolase